MCMGELWVEADGLSGNRPLDLPSAFKRVIEVAQESSRDLFLHMVTPVEDQGIAQRQVSLASSHQGASICRADAPSLSHGPMSARPAASIETTSPDGCSWPFTVSRRNVCLLPDPSTSFLSPRAQRLPTPFYEHFCQK